MTDNYVSSMFDIGKWKIDPTKLEGISHIFPVKEGDTIMDVGGKIDVPYDSYCFFAIVNRVKYCSSFYDEEKEAHVVQKELEKMQEEVAGMEK